MARPPITNAAELPPIGIHEAVDLDFKATVSTAAGYRFELAKDVAALANALGGSLLVGAHEKPAGRLDSYGLPATADPDAIVAAYEQSVRDRCRPAPLFSSERIDQYGKIVIAVNVEPTVTQPTAVRVTKDAISDEKYSGEAWCFPIRVGTQTAYLSPEVLPMYMLPNVRRTWLLLKAIPIHAVVELQRRATGQNYSNRFEVVFENVDERRNVVRVSHGAGKGGFNIPLDRIESVYEDGSKWIIICPH